MSLESPSLKIVVIVQARMGSERLPGKTLMKIRGKPVLGIILERLRGLKHPVEVIVATTLEKTDDCIVDFCKREKIAYFRGSEIDVLERYLKAARFFSGDVIVRITGDCPLVDSSVVDRVIDRFLEHYPQYDYVSNTMQRTFPRGLDVEVFKRRALESAFESAYLTEEREHVTPHIWRHPELYTLGNVAYNGDFSDFRLTLDTREDFELISKIFESFSGKGFMFDLEETLSLLKLHPDWIKINQLIKQKEI